MPLRRRFAFIDAQNTTSTTEQLLGFVTDWQRLYDFLKQGWQCEQVFLYTGIDVGDIETNSEMEQLRKSGCIVRAKTVFAYKNKNRKIDARCPACGKVFIEQVDMGYNKKSNCDVDLTVDAMECITPESEFYFFTGDGDFEYLARKAVQGGVVVHFVSSAKKIYSSPRYFTSRFSSKLRKLVAESKGKVDLLNIDNLKMKIQKI